MRGDGIGRASAEGLLIAYPVLGSGPWRNVVVAVLTFIFALLAVKGLVLLNIGVDKVEGMLDKDTFDNSWPSDKEIDEKEKLSDAQIKAMDDRVIAAFRKFAPFVRRSSG